MSSARPVDVHTHLSSEDFDADRPEVLARALSACDFIIDIGAGTSADSVQRAKNFAEANENVFFTAGVHPHDAETLGQDAQHLKLITDSLTHNKAVAVGECGLDYYYENSKPDIQKQVFDWHIQQSTTLNLPLMIHTRDAEADTKELLKSYQGTAAFHCFTGTQDLADFGISKGFYLSFSGIVTFKNAQDLRDVFLKTPLSQILIETDSPYLAPVPMRGKRNETSFIIHTAEFLANLKKMPVDEFISATNQNARRLFTKANMNPTLTRKTKIEIN